ncbi:MAG: HAD family hydrolase [Candidatus Saccharimonadales bacterium]
MIQLVVFDWNGTLFADTLAVLRAANQSEVPMLGLPPVTVATMRAVYEVPLVDAYVKLGVSREVFLAKAKEMTAVFHDAYEEFARTVRTRPGTKATLKKLQADGVNCIILSNHTQQGITTQLHRLKLEKYFSAVLANETTSQAHHTGKQHRLEHYLRLHNIAPSSVVIIGDTPEEPRIGKALGLHTVSITEGMASRKRLQQAEPDYLISSIPQLLTVLKRINS